MSITGAACTSSIIFSVNVTALQGVRNTDLYIHTTFTACCPHISSEDSSCAYSLAGCLLSFEKEDFRHRNSYFMTHLRARVPVEYAMHMRLLCNMQRELRLLLLAATHLCWGSYDCFVCVVMILICPDSFIWQRSTSIACCLHVLLPSIFIRYRISAMYAVTFRYILCYLSLSWCELEDLCLKAICCICLTLKFLKLEKKLSLLLLRVEKIFLITRKEVCTYSFI